MTPETTLIVSDSSATAHDLWRILTDDGVPALMRTPDAVLERWTATDGTPDVLLVDAALDVPTVRGLVRHVVAATDRAPTVVSFTREDFAALESHISAGLDFLVPPFLPHLVRGRLATCRQHHSLGRMVQEMQTAAQMREYERELQIGREIQRGFLPEYLPSIEGWDIAAYFEPAREVSGDFYDAYDIINGSFLGFAIADVCDKGVGAALFMALIRSLLRHAAVADDALGAPRADADSAARPLAGADLALRAVRTTNEYLTTNHLHQAYFATLFFGVVDPRSGELVYINCGHNPPIVRRADGEQTPLSPTGPALGLMHDAHFELGQVTLDRGDLLFLYTDGVPESKNVGGEFFGEERMRSVLAEPGPAETVVHRVKQAVTTHCGTAEQFDDVTILGLRRRPLVGDPRDGTGTRRRAEKG